MQAHEREQLNALLAQLVAARAEAKDGEAAALIRDAVARQPDAAYLLIQKVALQQQALQAAQARIEQLQGELERQRPAAGNAWGNSAWGQAPAPAAPVPQAPPAASQNSWGNGWLGNIASTAAGVVAGSFLYQGIENLLGHHGGNGLFGGGLSGTPNETTVVNNFFEDTPAGSGATDYALDDLASGLDDDSWL